jgi:transposase
MSQSTLSKRLASVKPGTLYVGVDLALDHHVAVVLDERAKQLTRFRFSNDREGYKYFRRRLRKLKEKHKAPAMLVGMEPTNYYWKLLAAELEQHEIMYRLVNPFTVKKHREGNQLDRSKDDLRDAFTIAELLRTGKYTETRLLHGAYAELRQLVTLHERLRRDTQRQKTLIVNLVGQLFPELRFVFRDLTCQTALGMLRSQAAAVRVSELSLSDFIGQVRATFQGRRLYVSKLSRAHALASTSVGLREGVQGLQLALRQHIDTLEHLRKQYQETREALTCVFLAMPQAKYLLSVHGLGLLTAATILAEIGDPSHYTRINQMIKLAGTQPVPNSSGRKSSSQTPMSHKGRPRLRTALYFAVMRLIRLDDSFALEYRRLQTRSKNPLCKMQALGVLMNKLLRILWALMRKQTFYLPCFQYAV